MNKIKTLTCLYGISMLIISACSSSNGNLTVSGLDPAKFDTTINNKKVELFVLKKQDMEVCITNFGARIVSISVPNKNGSLTDVVLGYDNIAQYTDSTNNPNSFGAVIGRYANGIAKGKVTIDGKKIQLPLNKMGHFRHGGNSGWEYRVFDGKLLNDSTLQLVINSKDGDNNFPGNVKATVTYTLKADNTLDMAFDAYTDKPTVINITNHSYFNLSGDHSKAGTNMILYINADYYTPLDTTLMTTGEIKPVYGTPMDLTQRHPLYQTIGDTAFHQIKYAEGYYHNWCLNTYANGKGDEKKMAASLYSPESGIIMKIYTNEPGMQVYTANFLDSKTKGKRGITYPKYAAVCLESQKYPDSPNKKGWPSPYIKPGEKYHSHVIYKFDILDN